MKKIFITATLLLLSGCDQYFRYPCQNPDMWNDPRCKKPLCEVNRDCPHLILEKQQILIPQQDKGAKSKGECGK